MTRDKKPEQDDLFPAPTERRVTLREDACLLPCFAAGAAPELLLAVRDVEAAAPFRHMVTPGGFRMSVAMTNCGRVGWVTDRSGYRYEALDPISKRPWPALPSVFMRLAAEAAAEAGFERFQPDCCLINRYAPGTRLSLHQDKNERDFRQPIVSIALGLPAVFLFGGDHRSDGVRRIGLRSADVMVWGGNARLAYHGIAAVPDGTHPLTGRYRINLTFRNAL